MSEPVLPQGTKSGETVLEFLLRIRAEQEASGCVPRSAEEIQEQLRQTDEEWDERDREIEAIHELGRQARLARQARNEPLYPPF